MAVENGVDTKPTFVAKPDMRFATTFIGSQYRDYSVNGESIMDKATGELMLKRPADGRVISFNQNKKYIHDLMLELRVLLTNNESFVYPSTSDAAFFMSTDYDLVTINDEKYLNIAEANDTTITNSDYDSVTAHKLQFKLSTGTNGFFCRPMSRDSDKTIIEYLTSEYNLMFENYDGTNATYLAEKEKFTTTSKWKDSNVILSYTVKVTKGETVKSYTLNDYVRCNEEMCVLLPMTNINADFTDGIDSIVVLINSLSYYKLHFMLNHKAEFTDTFRNGITKFMYPDSVIYINYLSIMSFIDKSTDAILLNNEYIIASLEMAYVLRYMSKLAKLKNSSEFIVSNNRPLDTEWDANTVWAERIRDVYENGYTIDREHEVNIKKLEEFIAKKPGITLTNVTDNSVLTEDFYLENYSAGTYSNEEINSRMATLNTYFTNQVNGTITEVTSDSDDSGSVATTTDGLTMSVETEETATTTDTTTTSEETTTESEGTTSE